MSVSYFRLPVPQRAITKPLVWRLWKENRLVVRHAAMIRDYWVSSFSRSQSGCNMCKVSFADNSETVGHTGIARLCCSQRTARTRTDCLLLQEEALASSGGGGCHNEKMNNLFRKSEFLSNLWRKLQIARPGCKKIFRKSCGNCRKNRRFFHEIPVCIKFFLIFTCNFVHNVLY